MHSNTLKETSLAENNNSAVKDGKFENKLVSLCKKNATRHVEIKSSQEFKSETGWVIVINKHKAVVLIVRNLCEL